MLTEMLSLSVQVALPTGATFNPQTLQFIYPRDAQRVGSYSVLEASDGEATTPYRVTLNALPITDSDGDGLSDQTEIDYMLDPLIETVTATPLTISPNFISMDVEHPMQMETMCSMHLTMIQMVTAGSMKKRSRATTSSSPPVDTDDDGIADFRDTDSDGDGIDDDVDLAPADQHRWRLPTRWQRRQCR